MYNPNLRNSKGRHLSLYIFISSDLSQPMCKKKKLYHVIKNMAKVFLVQEHIHLMGKSSTSVFHWSYDHTQAETSWGVWGQGQCCLELDASFWDGQVSFLGAPQLRAMMLEVLAGSRYLIWQRHHVDGNEPSIFLECFCFELQFHDTPIHHLLCHVDFLRSSFTGTGWYQHIREMVELKTNVALCNSVDSNLQDMLSTHLFVPIRLVCQLVHKDQYCNFTQSDQLVHPANTISIIIGDWYPILIIRHVQNGICVSEAGIQCHWEQLCIVIPVQRTPKARDVSKIWVRWCWQSHHMTFHLSKL